MAYLIFEDSHLVDFWADKRLKAPTKWGCPFRHLRATLVIIPLRRMGSWNPLSNDQGVAPFSELDFSDRCTSRVSSSSGLSQGRWMVFLWWNISRNGKLMILPKSHSLPHHEMSCRFVVSQNFSDRDSPIHITMDVHEKPPANFVSFW